MTRSAEALEVGKVERELGSGANARIVVHLRSGHQIALRKAAFAERILR